MRLHRRSLRRRPRLGDRSAGRRDGTGGDRRPAPSRCARTRSTRLPLPRQASRAAPDVKGRVSAIRSRSLGAAIAAAWAGTRLHVFGAKLAPGDARCRVSCPLAPSSMTAAWTCPVAAGCREGGAASGRFDAVFERSGTGVFLCRCPSGQRCGTVRDGFRCRPSCAKPSRSLRPQIRAEGVQPSWTGW